LHERGKFVRVFHTFEIAMGSVLPGAKVQHSGDMK